MTSREAELFHLLYAHRKPLSLYHISRRIGFSNTYVELILKSLLQKGFVEQEGHKVFMITAVGERYIEKRSLIPPLRSGVKVRIAYSNIQSSIDILTMKKRRDS